jgi:hypothetical protein
VTEPGDVLLGRQRSSEPLRRSGAPGRPGVVGDVFVVGGAAMAMAYNAARVTRDVDAAFKPHGIVLEEARKVADDLGLPFKPWAVREIKDFQNGPCCLLPASPSVSPRPSR